jgi:hypothetical protein
MLILPPKFKQALGNGVRTSLYPLVRIYKGYQIDDTIPDDAESINLSIKETNIGGEAYNPLLLNSPSISSKADIINNKYTISSVSLSISNAPYNGKMFSDDIPSLLNAVVQVYYAANGLDTLDDCLLVYTGTIRRYSQSAESLKLTLEDLTEQKLTTKIPATLIEDEDLYTDEQIGKPYPMVYGYVDGSPIIKRNLDTLEIEKPSKEIFGYWSGSDSYQNPSIQEGHPLVDSGHLKRNHYLSVYKDGFMPIYETGPKDWGSYYHENVDGAIFYEFNFADTDNSPNIILKPEAYLDTTQPNDDEETFAIPSRMYRPIINVSFYAKNTPNPPPLYCSNNKFIGYKDDDGSMQTITNNIVVVDDPDAHDNSESIAKDLYDEFWDGGPNEGDILKFWEPSEINAAYDLGTEGETSADFYDLNWKQFYNDNAEAAKFPIDIIQNADENSGLHITSVNRGEYFETGAFARLHLNEVGIVGDFPCVTKIKYDACFFSNGNIQNYTGYTNQGTQPRFASFWTDRHLKFIGTNTPDFINTLDQWYYHIGSYMALPPSFPNNINEMVITERDVDNNYPDYARLEYEDGLLHDDFHDKILGFNTTNAFDSIQFGTGVFLGNQGVNYVSANLKEIYVLQDFIIEDYANLDYYASVGGRVKDGDIITTAQDILEDILKDELLYEGVINNQNTNIQNEWQYAFTLNEQKEAKQVFEDIFKSSLLIPSFNSSGQFKFIGIKQLINNYSDVVFINTEDVIKYSFQLTKLDDVYNSVNVKYKKSYGSGEYDKQTGYEIGNTIHTTLDDYTTTELGYGGNNAYDINYYGLDSEDAKLEVETEYIRDKYTAARLQKRLLLWHCNQHLITKVDLPAHYIHLEAGDYIKYSELLGGKLAFGYDYSRIEHRNGQLMYPAFFITKVSKSLSKVSIEAVQVHRGEYGFPNLEADTDPNAEDEGDIVNGDGNDITDNNQLPDPQDDPNYNEDSIDTEEWDSIVDPFLRLDIPTLGILNDGTVHALVTTNMDELWEYNIWAKNISETFVYDGVTYNEGLEIPNGEIDASNLVSHALSMTDNNGIITIEKKFELYPEGAFIEFTLEVKNTADYQDEGYFTQFGETPWVFNEIYGDVNQDDILNVLDIVTIVTAILDATTDELPDDGEGRSIADITDDGQVNVLDLVQIVNEIVGQ